MKKDQHKNYMNEIAQLEEEENKDENDGELKEKGKYKIKSKEDYLRAMEKKRNRVLFNCI